MSGPCDRLAAREQDNRDIPPVAGNSHTFLPGWPAAGGSRPFPLHRLPGKARFRTNLFHQPRSCFSLPPAVWTLRQAPLPDMSAGHQGSEAGVRRSGEVPLLTWDRLCPRPWGLSCQEIRTLCRHLDTWDWQSRDICYRRMEGSSCGISESHAFCFFKYK